MLPFGNSKEEISSIAMVDDEKRMKQTKREKRFKTEETQSSSNWWLVGPKPCGGDEWKLGKEREEKGKETILVQWCLKKRSNDLFDGEYKGNK